MPINHNNQSDIVWRDDNGTTVCNASGMNNAMHCSFSSSNSSICIETHSVRPISGAYKFQYTKLNHVYDMSLKSLQNILSIDNNITIWNKCYAHQNGPKFLGSCSVRLLNFAEIAMKEFR